MKARVVTVPVGSLLPGLSIYRPEDRGIETDEL
jgi:hypothetical protein